MKTNNSTLIASACACVALAATPLWAQNKAPADPPQPAQPIVLEGKAETVVWDMKEGKVLLNEKGSAQKWEISLPGSQTLLEMGLSAETLQRGADLKIRAVKNTDAACDPACKAKAVELTVGGSSKSYAMISSPNS